MLRLDASESVTPETDAEPWLAELVSCCCALEFNVCSTAGSHVGRFIDGVGLLAAVLDV